MQGRCADALSKLQLGRGGSAAQGVAEALCAYCRLYVINRCPRLKVLDFRKVKQKVLPALQACSPTLLLMPGTRIGKSLPARLPA